MTKMFSRIGTFSQNDWKESYSTEWKIPHFLSAKTTRECRPLQCKDDAQKSNYFQLRMNLLGHKKKNIAIYFQTSHTVLMKLNLDLITADSPSGTPIKVIDYNSFVGNRWTYLVTLFRNEIEVDKTEYLTADGTLHIKIFCMISKDVKQPDLPIAQSNNILTELLESALFSDATIVSEDGKEFKVHKVLLASKSEVFMAMFSHDMKEEKPNLSKTHLDSAMFGDLLSYIYTGKCKLMNSHTSELLAAADFYQIGGLKSTCEETLRRKLDVDNAIDILELADKYSVFDLKELVLDFIKGGQAKYVLKSEGWKNLKSPDLLKTIFQFVNDDFTDEDRTESEDE